MADSSWAAACARSRAKTSATPSSAPAPSSALPDREILHLLPRQFILDNQPGIFDPVGMVGARLQVDLHIATCSGSAMQSTVTCANRAGLEVSEAVLESIAAAESTLSVDERELGVCLLDIGAHSSDLAVFFEGAVAHTASVPIGGHTSPTILPSVCRCQWLRPRNSSASMAMPS